MTSQAYTVAGVFPDYATAQRAARELTKEGILRESINIQSNNRTAMAGSSEYNPGEQEGGISGFFHRLFGGEDDSQQYSNALERGSAVLTVEAAQARQIT